jgi:hypothetical protein
MDNLDRGIVGSSPEAGEDYRRTNRTNYVESSAGTRVFLTRAGQSFRTYRTCVSRFATSFGLPQVRDKVAVWKRFGPTVCERQRVAQGSCKCGWRKVQRQGLPQRIGCTFRVPNRYTGSKRKCTCWTSTMWPCCSPIWRLTKSSIGFG